MQLPKETVKSIAELGFIACRWPTMREFALGIFRGVVMAAPENPAWIIGIAMVYANCDNDADAAQQFMASQGIRAHSGDLMARAFYGLFLVTAKKVSEGEKVMLAILADGSDEAACHLAQSVLDNEVYTSK